MREYRTKPGLKTPQKKQSVAAKKSKSPENDSTTTKTPHPCKSDGVFLLLRNSLREVRTPTQMK